MRRMLLKSETATNGSPPYVRAPLRNSTELEEQAAGSCVFATVDMATDDDGQVLLIGGT